MVRRLVGLVTTFLTMFRPPKVRGANRTTLVVLVVCESLPYKTEVNFLGERTEQASPLST